MKAGLFAAFGNLGYMLLGLPLGKCAHIDNIESLAKKLRDI